MNKIGIGVVAVCSCLVLVILVMSRQEEEVVAAEFFPENVLFYGEQHDFSEKYYTFRRSRLGETIARLQYEETAAEMGIPTEKIEEMEDCRRKIIKILESPVLHALFGREVSIGLFPADSFATTGSDGSFEEKLLLIARPRHNSHLLTFLSSFLTENIQQATIQYGSHTITRYRTDDKRTLSTVSVKGLLLAGLNERLLRKSLDCYDEKKGALQQNPAFQKLRKKLSRAKLFMYLSLPGLFEEGRTLAQRLPVEEQQPFLSLLNQWKGWGEAGYGTWQEGGLVQSKALILYDSRQLDSRVAELCAVSPSFNKTLRMVPPDVLLYNWSNTFNLPLLWELFSSWMGDHQGDMNILRQEVRDSTGVEVDDLLTMVGNEFAFLLKDVDSGGVPLPKAALVIQLTEPQAFLAAFEKLLAVAEIPIRKKKYKGEKIAYWGLAPQGGLQPAFSLQGEYLLLSNSIDVIKELVDQHSDPQSTFLENPNIQQVASGLSLDNNSVSYVDIALLTEVLKDLASWLGTVAMLQGQEVARTSQVVVEQIILPLLDGVAMYSKLGSRTIIDNDTIVMETTTSVIQ